jgi:hypothetical protein
VKTYWTILLEDDGKSAPDSTGYEAVFCAELSTGESPDLGEVETGVRELLRQRDLPFPEGIFAPIVTPDAERHEPPDVPGWTGKNLKLWYLD